MSVSRQGSSVSKSVPVDPFWERHLPPPDSVLRSFGPRSFEAGSDLFEQGAVTRLLFRERRLEAIVRGGRRFTPSWAVGAGGGLQLDCNCRRRFYCEHQVALYLQAREHFHGSSKPPAASSSRRQGGLGRWVVDGEGFEASLFGEKVPAPTGRYRFDPRPIEVRLRGRLRSDGLVVQPRLFLGEKAFRPRRLVLLDARRLHWLEGRTVYRQDPRASTEEIEAAVQRRELEIRDPEGIVEALRSGRVQLEDSSDGLVFETDARLRLKLELETSRIRLLAFLEGSAGHRWEVGGSPRSLKDGVFALCPAQAMEEANFRLRAAGFLPAEQPGEFRLSFPSPAFDRFVEGILPLWKRLYDVELDASLREFLKGAGRLRPRLGLNFPDSSGDWLEVRWGLEDESGRPLSTRELKSLLGAPSKVHRLRSGRLVRIDGDELLRQLEELRATGWRSGRPSESRRISVAAGLRLAEFYSEAPPAGRTNEAQVELSGSLQELREVLEGRLPLPQLELPPKLDGVLRPYQKVGASFLHFLCERRLGGILADDMGLGKTLQALVVLEVLRRREGPAPSLIVCPTSVAPNWVAEARRFTPELRAHHARSGSELKGLDFADYDLVVASYGLVRRHPPSYPFRCVFLDEAQFIKNSESRTARAVKSLEARHRLALTGTPVENSVTELWSLFDFVLPGYLGTRLHFNRNFGKPIMKRGEAEPLKRLGRLVRPFLLRRLKQEVARDLPPRIEQDVLCELTAEQKRLYLQCVRAARREIDREIREKGWEKSRLHILAALTRLRQICCHPGLVDPEKKGLSSGKLETLNELLQSILSGGHRVLVFSQFVQLLRLVRRLLERERVSSLYLDGATRHRARTVERFQNGEAPVFLISLKAGGTGLNLTAADYVVLLDPWWNPAVESQAVDRTHRIGQERVVTAYRLVARDTLEEKMMRLKEWKREVARRVVPGEASALEGLNREDVDWLLSG